MHIWLRIIALRLFSAQQRSSTHGSPLLTAKWIYLHDFLTYTDEKYTCNMSVMLNVSNALNSTNIFTVCHGGSIRSMIDINDCLRISVHKLLRLCELILSFIPALAPIDLLGYFKSGFGLKSPLFLRSPQYCCDSSYSRAVVMNERAWDRFERRNQSTHKILVTDYWSLSKQ